MAHTRLRRPARFNHVSSDRDRARFYITPSFDTALKRFQRGIELLISIEFLVIISTQGGIGNKGLVELNEVARGGVERWHFSATNTCQQKHQGTQKCREPACPTRGTGNPGRP